MDQKKISGGVVHTLPADLKKALISDPKALTVWEDITPLARNEWICWIESAKKAETRKPRARLEAFACEDEFHRSRLNRERPDVRRDYFLEADLEADLVCASAECL